MTSILGNSGIASLALIVCISLTVPACQSDNQMELEAIQQQWNDQRGEPMVNHGRVAIRLEPHGSVRARVYQGEIPVYEFILDRETQQHTLTGDINEADVYLTGQHRDGLVIDDLQNRKRYVLSCYDSTDQLNPIPTIQRKTVFIKGYATGVAPLTESVASN